MKESSYSGRARRIIGLWDLDVAPINLGGMLVLVEELLIQRSISQAGGVDVCIVGGEPKYVWRDTGSRCLASLRLIDSDASNDFAVLAAACLDGVENCYWSETVADVEEFALLGSERYILWPRGVRRGSTQYSYGSTRVVQAFYRKYGFIPFLSVRPCHLAWAREFIASRVSPSLAVAVHLKNDPHVKGCSNADVSAWRDFFSACWQRFDVKFILIGADPIDPGIAVMPNVLVSRDLGSNLPGDLALIQESLFFMGMASGPCALAVFCGVPYVIYKNPDHHAQEMALELGASDRFPFATAFQRIVRVFETCDDLMAEFTTLYNHLSGLDIEAAG